MVTEHECSTPPLRLADANSYGCGGLGEPRASSGGAKRVAPTDDLTNLIFLKPPSTLGAPASYLQKWYDECADLDHFAAPKEADYKASETRLVARARAST